MTLFTLDPVAETKILETLDKLARLDAYATDIKDRIKLGKLELKQTLSEAGLENVLVVDNQIVSARSKRSASDGPLFNPSPRDVVGDIMRDMKTSLERDGVSMSISASNLDR